MPRKLSTESFKTMFNSQEEFIANNKLISIGKTYQQVSTVDRLTRLFGLKLIS